MQRNTFITKVLAGFWLVNCFLVLLQNLVSVFKHSISRTLIKGSNDNVAMLKDVYHFLSLQKKDAIYSHTYQSIKTILFLPSISCFLDDLKII